MLNKIYLKSDFVKNVLTLLSGTAFAQAIPIALLPILTRIFTPEDFGVFALFLSITLILSVLSTGRYELTILLPIEDRDSNALFLLSIILSLITGVILFIPIFFFNSEITFWLGNPELSFWLYFIPLSVFLSGVSQSFNYRFNRNKSYKILSSGKIIQTGVSTGSQIMLGFSKLISGGLIFGSIIGQIFTSFFYFLNSKEKNKIFPVSFLEIKKNGLLYKNYPIYNSTTALLDKATVSLPSIYLTKFFSLQSAGYYAMCEKLIYGPASLFSFSISQVLIEFISNAHRNNISYRTKIIEIFFKLLLIGIFPFTFLFFYSEDLFNLFLGKEWTEAGKYSKILTVAFFARFVVSPLSVVFVAINKPSVLSYWQIAYFFAAVIAAIIGYILSDIFLYFIIFTINEVIMYGIYLFLVFKISK
jgi:O-antigen/teichoic acid export membrane protein